MFSRGRFFILFLAIPVFPQSPTEGGRKISVLFHTKLFCLRCCRLTGIIFVCELMLTFFSTVAPVFVALGNIMCSVWRFAHTIQQRHIHTSAFVCDAHTPQTPPIKTRALIQDISHVSCKSIAVNLEYSLTLYRQHLLVHCTFPLPLSSLPWLVLWQKRTHTLLRLYFTFYYPLPLKSTK